MASLNNQSNITIFDQCAEKILAPYHVQLGGISLEYSDLINGPTRGSSQQHTVHTEA